MYNVDKIIAEHLQSARSKLEIHFDADVLAYYGEISTTYISWFRQCLDKMGEERDRKPRLVVVLNTGGGEVEAVERMVEMQRHFYSEVYFVIPNISNVSRNNLQYVR